MTDTQITQREFFYELYPDLEGWIELRGISRTGKPAIQRFFNNLDDFLEAIPQSQEAQKGYDIYFGVLPRAKPEGTKAAITQAQVAWVDIDHDVELALKAIEAFPYPYGCLTNSGRGVHAYWLLKEPVDISTPELQADYEGRLRGLAETLGGDKQACDVTRIMRVPGTVNLKE